MAQQGRFDGQPAVLIQRALKLDPANIKALALAATADMRAGRRDQAIVNWKKLKSLVEKDSDDSRQIDAIIAEVEGGRTGSSPVSPALPATASAPAPATPKTSPAANSVASASAAKVTGKVILAPEMAAKIAPGDTLFVFARAKQGSRMPLAILRIPAPKADKFPHAFELTDAMAMAPGMNLSSAAEVVIEARISKSGNAQLQPGDVSGVSAPVKPGAANVNVTLSTVVP
jgi:cytochrome c-type biogenesis protein CcmH